jgi:TonB-dependent SusC/RagA subfamily outer membrane receptor
LRLELPEADVRGNGVIVHDTVNTGTGAIVRDTARPVVAARTGESGDLRKCLFILDSKVSSHEEVFKLSPARIASINILKDKSAEAIYGSAAKDGVVVVTTRAPGIKGDAIITSIEKGDTTTMRADTIQLRVAGENR